MARKEQRGRRTRTKPQAMKDGKIIDKMRHCMAEGKPFYSFEYFPPKTAAGVNNLYARLDRMAQLEPLFMDVTWGAGGTTEQLTLDISTNAQKYCSADVMMHLTCTNLPIEQTKAALEKAKAGGIRNILALRGDPPHGQDEWEQTEGGFQYATDLVKYIKEEYGDYFGIGVACYPEGHISAVDFETDLKYLKEKVDAGADFMISQLFYDVPQFIRFMARCREIGITVPIVPGIMPIQNYNSFMRMTTFCKTQIPDEILKSLEAIKADDEAVKAFGIELAARMCRQLLAAGCPGMHFYTLNLEKSVTNILSELKYIDTTKLAASLPWQPSQLSKRHSAETVRPIFWANRPTSYQDRTAFWDEFPNGRWGDSSSPAFGDIEHHLLQNFRTSKKGDRLKMWKDTLTSPSDVFDVFTAYIGGDIDRLPWCEKSLAVESTPLSSTLISLNKAGFLTINSQPRVNGAPSDDPAVGWGSADGYVYQKAYIEFFVSAANMQKIVDAAKECPSIQYCAIRAHETEPSFRANSKQQSGVTAVTWGVFPGQEVVQPTIVDEQSFVFWKDEAFALWKSQWQSLYEKDSSSYDVIGTIHDTFYLCNIVDNDFVKGDLFAFMEKVLA